MFQDGMLSATDMKLFDWRGKNWHQRVFLILTIAVLVVLASYPELRAFLPLIDALGLDLLLLLMGAQLVEYLRPLLLAAHAQLIRPVSERLYSLLLFLFGMAGPYVDARLATYCLARDTATP